MTVGRETPVGFTIGGAASSPVTFSYTQPSNGSNRALTLTVAYDGSYVSDPFTAITYNSVEMNDYAGYSRVAAGNYGSVVFRVMLNPPTGANTVSLSWSASPPGACCGAMWSLYDVDQTTPIDNNAEKTETLSASPASYTGRTTRNGDMPYMAMGFSNDGISTYDGSGGTTLAWSQEVNNVGALAAAAVYEDATGTSADMYMALSPLGGQNGTFLYVNIRAAAAAAGTPPHARPYSPDAAGMRTVLRM